MQQGVRADQHQNRFEVPPQPDCDWRQQLCQPLREGDDHLSRSPCQPRLQRVPSRQIDLGTIALLRQRPEYRRRLVAGVGDGETEHPRLVFGMEAQARRCHDQPSRSFPLDQARYQAFRCLLDRFVAHASLGQQRPDQIGGELRGHSGCFVDDEMAVLQRLAGVSQRPVAHRRQGIKRFVSGKNFSVNSTTKDLPPEDGPLTATETGLSNRRDVTAR